MEKDNSVIVTWPDVPNTDTIVFKDVVVLGMKLIEVSYQSCVAHFAISNDWATLYDISSMEEGKGHAQEILFHCMHYYEQHGKTFGSTVALSPAMKHILIKLGIKEYV